MEDFSLNVVRVITAINKGSDWWYDCKLFEIISKLGLSLINGLVPVDDGCCLLNDLD